MVSSNIKSVMIHRVPIICRGYKNPLLLFLNYLSFFYSGIFVNPSLAMLFWINLAYLSLKDDVT